MKEKGINYREFKKRQKKKYPDMFKLTILEDKNKDPRFIKP